VLMSPGMGCIDDIIIGAARYPPVTMPLLMAESCIAGGGCFGGSGGGMLVGIGAATSFKVLSTSVVGAGGAGVTGGGGSVGNLPVAAGISATGFDTLQPASITSKASSRVRNRAFMFMGRLSSGGGLLRFVKDETRA
ncbi:MAG TPA: hypothetical protein VIM06_00795, partial [Rhodanobacter sp.]